MDRGGGMRPEEGGEPLPVRQRWAGGSVADSDQVPLTGGLGQSGADSGATRYDDDLRSVRELILVL